MLGIRRLRRSFEHGVHPAHHKEQTEDLPILSFSLAPVCKHIRTYFG